MCLFSCFILFSFVLADIWQKLKFITISLIKVRLLFLLTLLVSTWFSCCIFIFCFLFIQRHIFKSIIFNIEDNVWFRFGGDVYIFLSICFVLFGCVFFFKYIYKKIKNKKSFAWLEVYVLSLLYYSYLKNFIVFMINSLHMHVAT